MKKKSNSAFLRTTLILILVVVSQLIAGFAFAQKGTLRGGIFEEGSGEPLYGVSILVKETSTGAITDFDGKFEIQVEPGFYTLQISYISYATVNLTGVEIKAGEITVLNDILMADEVSELETVTIAATAIRTTDVGEKKCCKLNGRYFGKCIQENRRR